MLWCFALLVQDCTAALTLSHKQGHEGDDSEEAKYGDVDGRWGGDGSCDGEAQGGHGGVEEEQVQEGNLFKGAHRVPQIQHS